MIIEAEARALVAWGFRQGLLKVSPGPAVTYLDWKKKKARAEQRRIGNSQPWGQLCACGAQATHQNAGAPECERCRAVRSGQSRELRGYHFSQEKRRRSRES